MLPPLPRCSRWAYSSLKITHPCQPSPIPLSRRPAHRPFRGLLSVHSRCGLHTCAVTKCVTAIRGLQTFRRLHACPGCFRLERFRRVGLAPTGKRRLLTAHVGSGPSRHIVFRSALRHSGHSRAELGLGDRRGVSRDRRLAPTGRAWLQCAQTSVLSALSPPICGVAT
jgi:hypothetical protein